MDKATSSKVFFMAASFDNIFGNSDDLKMMIYVISLVAEYRLTLNIRLKQIWPAKSFIVP